MPRRSGGGSVLPYTVVALVALTGICSLAVDWARVQSVKTDMESCADATARSYIDLYANYGMSTATAYGPFLSTSAYNPVDASSGVQPTITATWGTWDTTARTFTPGGSSGSVAVRVTIARKAATGNGIPLVWGGLIGKRTCDVQVSSTAAVLGGTSGNVNVPSVASPYLAGMPAGTTGTYGDNAVNATPYQVSSVSVVPGTYISFTNVSGTTSIVPGYVGYTNADGNNTYKLHHGQNWDSNPNIPGPENGIADAVMPANALMGVFLTNAAPTAMTAPATIDWTQGSVANQPTYSNIQLQQPFMIGNGSTTTGTVQKFLVPPGATRLYLGIWDGTQYSNNGGSFSGTISVTQVTGVVQ